MSKNKKAAADEQDHDRPRKKFKLMDTSFDFFSLPNDCWHAISEYLSPNSASSCYLVSKSFRRLHEAFMTRYCHQIHDLPTDAVQFLPRAVTRSLSNIGVYLFFEQALYHAENKKYNELAETLKKLQYRAEMIAITKLIMLTVPKHLIEAKYLKSVCYSDFFRKIEYVWEDSDSSTHNMIQKSSFIWVGKDRRYIDVKCEYNELYTHGDGQGWLEFKITVILKQLGMEDSGNNGQIIVFEFKKDNDDDDATHSIAECIFDKYDERKFFEEDDIRKIMDWMKVDLLVENSPKNFMKVLLNLAVNQTIRMPMNENWFGYDPNIKFDEYDEDVDRDEDSFQISNLRAKYHTEIGNNINFVTEITHLMRFYLNWTEGPDPYVSWVFKAQFVLKRLLLKLSLIQCIDKIQISSDDAKRELSDLFERGLVYDCSIKKARFDVPKTQYSKQKPCFGNIQSVELSFSFPDGGDWFINLECHYEGSPGNFTSDFTVNLEVKSDGSCRIDFESIDEPTKKKFLARFKDTFQKIRQLGEAKNVTDVDWMELMLAYLEPPGEAEVSYEADYYNSEGDNEE